MTAHTRSQPDAYEQTGAGVRELLHRFNTAKTREEFQWIAAEAEQRGARPGLEPPIETAYGVLASLARKRLAPFATGEFPRPRRVTPEELAAASRIISLGCDLDDLQTAGMVVERWDDVPPPNQNLLLARDLIRAHVEQLLERLRRAALPASDTAEGAR
jgi:hypothetical protein